MKKTILVVVVVIFFISSAAFGITMSGINIPESVKLKKSELVLNGIGLRSKYGFKIYYAGFYLPKKTTDHIKIINADEPQALIMYWRRTADVKKIQEVFLKSLAVAVHAPEKRKYTLDSNFGPYSSIIKRFVSWVSEIDVKKKHVWSFNYTPGKGLDVYVYDTKKNEFKGNIPGLEFKKILWRVWIADNQTVGDQMRKDMLGIK